MCRSKLEHTRKCDIFGADIGLTFKEDDDYHTKVGGCFTILIFVLLLGNFVQEVTYFFTATSYEKMRTMNYNEYVSSINQEWSMSTKNVTLAV